ncbi:asparaginase [Psychrobacter lutiphocae]|uniref:asparaginase n=1 Tax=Psychrobacter lutiphocae TaxID=540500 RepID=UPI000365B550|nr:asparaginase [Psychrobacter lutiphocae]
MTAPQSTASDLPSNTSAQPIDSAATANTAINQPLQLIYAGGTFGSYGKPLAALPADEFLPVLLEHIQQQLTPHVQVLPNTCVKDSSQLTPIDLTHFFSIILDSYAQGHRQFVLITGTDTLSYLGSFLAEAFAGSDVCIVLTASMRPLFDAEQLHSYQIDANSDAWGNLTQAVGLASHGDPGVYIAIAEESWPAQTVQKIHSHDLMAFTGHHRAGYPANSYDKRLPTARRQNWIEDSRAKLNDIKHNAQSVNIATLYCMPNNDGWLADQLAALTQQPAMGIILIGFGAGNIPYTEALATTMDTLYKQGHMLVCGTQCPFGGVSDTYAAGSWQYEHHVLSAGRLTLPAVYARLLWLHLAYDTPARRRQRWRHSVQKV